MRILTATQIRELDAFTIANAPISSIDLMERAARAVFSELLATEDLNHAAVVCGMGNNGGDGLALARMLAEVQSCSVQVVVVHHSEKESPDFKVNAERLASSGVEVIRISEIPSFPTLHDGTLIIDALLGSGLSRPLSGILAEVVNHINTLSARVISIDMPTGLFCEDNTGNEGSAIINADRTLTFHCPKLSLLFSENAIYAGDVTVLDIGLMEQEMGVSSSEVLVTDDLAAAHVRLRPRFSHKGTYGHALLLAGRYGSMGAAFLAAKGCLRSGTGLLTAHIPELGVNIMQTSLPEAMCSVEGNDRFISALPSLERYSAVGMGPAIGNHSDTANALKALIQNTKVPLVLDADALNILAENKTWLSFLPPLTVLTPHPKEFDRMVGESNTGWERWKKQREFAIRYNCVVALKGANTTICNPAGQTFFNDSGNPGMATAGSGDVLTGVILGLLAQGHPPTEAAVLGVYTHGLAGDIAAKKTGQQALLASDIIDALGKAQMHLSE